MNTTNRKNWNSQLYLDTLGSLAVIAAGAFVALFVAAAALPDAIAGESLVADSCAVARVAAASPGHTQASAPRQVAGTACA